MGLRFRKSIRLFPGLRMSLSRSGIGLSAGVRGASLSAGPRGTALNLSIPGTGLSYRQVLGQPAQQGRAAHYELRAAARAHERAEIAQTALEVHRHQLQKVVEENEGIAALITILRDRTKEPFDFEGLLRSRGPFVPVPWQELPYRSDTRDLAMRAEHAYGTEGWIAMLIFGIPAALFQLPGLWRLAGVLLVVTTGFGGMVWQHGRRQKEAKRLDGEERLAWEREQAQRREAHDADQQARAQAHEAEEAARARLRDAVAQGDPEPLSELLVEELVNEDFSIPVVAEVDFEGLSCVRIDYTLPDLDDVPEDRATVLASGRISRKRVAQKDRVSIYEDLCCGIAFRLIYETFRVLPMVRQVILDGTFTEADASGNNVDRVALQLSFTREAFDQLNLDRIDASDAARAHGKWGCTKKGELRHVAG